MRGKVNLTSLSCQRNNLSDGRSYHQTEQKGPSKSSPRESTAGLPGGSAVKNLPASAGDGV